MVVSQGVALMAGAVAACAAGVHGGFTRTRWYVIVLRMLALLYAGWIVSVTVLPLGLGAPEVGRVEGVYLEYSVNLVPFKTVMLYLGSDLGRIAAVNLLGNLALLAPLGLFGPIMWERFDRWWKVLLAGAGASVVIEAAQYVRQIVNIDGLGRSVDIDDVILNAAGALLGYVVFVLVRGLVRLPGARRRRSVRQAAR